MTKFFFKLTRKNWGFPWHIILALIGTQTLLIWFSWFVPLFALNLLGFAYERWQKNSEAAQDMIANNIGIILGILLCEKYFLF